MEIENLYLNRQSCRNFSGEKVNEETLKKAIELANLAPSACNAQPYYITVVTGESVSKIALATQRLGVNKFTDKASCFVVVSEGKSNTLAKFGERLKGLDFKQIDIGIWTAHFVLCAKELGLDTCILGWFTEDKIKEIETQNNCTVYAVTHEFTSFGECYDFLIVTDYKEDWEYLLTKAEQGFYATAYVWNKSDEYCSEFGDISVVSFGGGIKRIG